MIISTDVEQSAKKISNKPVKRNIAPSASNLLADMFSFLLDVSPESIPETEQDNLYRLLGDLSWLDQRQISEALHFAKKSSTGARSKSRKWYKQNRGRAAKLQMKLKKSKAAKKKKEIMAKSDRTPIKKRKKKKYNTTNHVNEAINRSIEKGVRETVSKWFAPTPYRVIKTFQVTENLDAVLNELVEHICHNIWRLTKRDGKQYKFEVENNNIIKQCVKHEAIIEIGDFI